MKMIQRLKPEIVGSWVVSYALYECPRCGTEFKANVSDIKRGRKKNCGCVVEIAIPTEVNGIKILKDLGTKDTGRRKVSIECVLCGTPYTVQMDGLKRGVYTKHCGCKKHIPKAKITQRVIALRSLLWDNPVFSGWTEDDFRVLKFTHGSMIARCNRPNHPKYKRYGERGITVCQRWRSLYHFCLDVGKRPSNDLIIDRINNDGNYEPGNTRWATQKEQQNNKGSNSVTT